MLDSKTTELLLDLLLCAFAFCMCEIDTYTYLHCNM